MMIIMPTAKKHDACWNCFQSCFVIIWKHLHICCEWVFLCAFIVNVHPFYFTLSLFNSMFIVELLTLCKAVESVMEPESGQFSHMHCLPDFKSHHLCNKFWDHLPQKICCILYSPCVKYFSVFYVVYQVRLDSLEMKKQMLWLATARNLDVFYIMVAIQLGSGHWK
jgi:hypothetical protein